MATCSGTRTKQHNRCGSSVYKCNSCGSVDCEQGQPNTCSNQGFSGGKRLRCGKHGQKESVK
jgi:hypothetical protein